MSTFEICLYVGSLSFLLGSIVTWKFAWWSLVERRRESQQACKSSEGK